MAAKNEKKPKKPRAPIVATKETTPLAVKHRPAREDGSALWRVYTPITDVPSDLCPIGDKEKDRGVGADPKTYRKVQLIVRPAKRDKIPQVGADEYRGPYLRFCHAPKKPGTVVRADSPAHAIKLGLAFKRCEGSPKYCAEKVGATVTSALGGLGRGFLRRRKGV